MKRHERPKQPRTIEDLEFKYHQQLVFLTRSCRIFDIGLEDEAPRLSVPLRALLHKTSKSHSLLSTLGLIDKLDFVDSGVRRDLFVKAIEDVRDKSDGGFFMPSLSELGLVVPVISGGEGKFIAPLVDNRFDPQDPRYKSIVQTRKFDDWWNTAFIESFDGKTLSRADLVLTMRV